MDQFMSSTWSPTTSPIPTSTSFTSIDPTATAALIQSLNDAISSAKTMTALGDLYSVSQVIRGAQASLTAVSAQGVLATATAPAVQAAASEALWDATLNLQALKWDMNLYGTWLSAGGNGLFTALFLLVFILHIVFMGWSRYWYVGVCLICGTALEWIGYLGRALAVHHTSKDDYFLLQIVVLTIAPAFVMAGVYYYLAKLIVVHAPGRKYSMLKPTWYSFIFVFCDILSLVIQAIGGGMAASASAEYKDPDDGTHVMIAGIAFQVFSMTLFLFFWLDFLYRVFFKVTDEVKFSWGNFWSLLINNRKSHDIRNKLEPYYDQEHKEIRSRRFFKWFPHAITASVIFIYIRCIYRLVELAQGWSGYLITHEEYVLTLDAMVVWFTCITLVIFHPLILFGKGKRLPIRERKISDIEEKNGDLSDSEQNTLNQKKEELQKF